MTRGTDESGTRIGIIPAAAAAVMPLSESSRTTHARGSQPRRRAASRKMSGAGLPCSTSSPPTVAVTASSAPASRSREPTLARVLELATATGMCSRFAQPSSSNRPFLATTGSALEYVSARSQISVRVPRLAGCSSHHAVIRVQQSLFVLPSSCACCSPVNDQPKSSAARVQERNSTASVSIISPSMSRIRAQNDRSASRCRSRMSSVRKALSRPLCTVRHELSLIEAVSRVLLFGGRPG
jgi:hypothetical protein